MGHVVQVLLGYHLLVNPEEGSGQGHDGGGQLLIDQPVHHVGDVTEQLLEEDVCLEVSVDCLYKLFKLHY